MIKKSVFEDELIAGMQRELQPFEKKAGMNSLGKAVDYLHSAVQIFEEAGMTAKADQVLRILGKIALAAGETHVRHMPSIKALMGAGVTPEDLANIKDPFSKARVNTAMRMLGHTDRELKDFLGENFLSEQEASDLLSPDRPYKDIAKWIEDPFAPVDPNDPKPGEEISFQSVPAIGKGDELSFNSIAFDEQDAKGKKSKPADRHTSGLTSEKMIANLKNHGTVFNMADDGFADDLLDQDLNDAAVEVFDRNPEDKTFEDAD